MKYITQNASLRQQPYSGSSASHSLNNYRFHKASVLDIPYIFGLLQEGSLIGSFSNSLMTSAGYRWTLKTLFIAVVPLLQRFSRNTEKINTFIFCLNNDDIGFIAITLPTNNENVQIIELCAIDPAFRNQDHGARMLHKYLESLPNGTEVITHCTKYSRAMQHILIKKKFRRDKRSFPLETFRLVKGENTNLPNTPPISA